MSLIKKIKNKLIKWLGGYTELPETKVIVEPVVMYKTEKDVIPIYTEVSVNYCLLNEFEKEIIEREIKSQMRISLADKIIDVMEIQEYTDLKSGNKTYKGIINVFMP